MGTLFEVLIPVCVIFILSLIGSVILFKFLKSWATIKNKTHQAGGAIAGFILIYSLLYFSFDQWYKSERSQEWKPEEWTIKGYVKMEGKNIHDGITVRHIPDAPSTESRTDGYFALKDVEIVPKEIPAGLPDLEFDTGGDKFHHRTLELNKKNVDIDKEKKNIILKEDLVLVKIE